MGHDDLERRLRSERGPREAGYAPADLPASIEARSRPRWAATIVRGGLLAAAAGAAVLAVIVVSGGLGGRGGFGDGGVSPTPGDATSQAPTPTMTPAQELGSCQPGQVVMTAEPWGGAAGSRGTTVTLSLAPGAAACHPSVSAVGRVLDGQGVPVIESVAGPVDLPLLTLEAGTTYQVGVAWSNWCDPAPAGPLSLQLRLSDWSSWATVAVAAGGADPVPPCNGDGGSNLSVTGLQAMP